MKKLLMALFTVALCAGFAACSSNDDNEPSIADKVVGVYVGQTAAWLLFNTLLLPTLPMATQSS